MIGIIRVPHPPPPVAEARRELWVSRVAPCGGVAPFTREAWVRGKGVSGNPWVSSEMILLLGDVFPPTTTIRVLGTICGPPRAGRRAHSRGSVGAGASALPALLTGPAAGAGAVGRAGGSTAGVVAPAGAGAAWPTHSPSTQIRSPLHCVSY